MDFTTTMKEQLEERRANLRRRGEKIEVHLHQKDGPLSADWQEQATELENYGVLEALDDYGRKELTEIEEALKRIESGDYGYCTACDGEVAEGRLKAVPHARLCIKCAEELEKQASAR
jgi:RNA polymerase-binding protein DksA